MGEILIPRRTKVERAYELLADITVGAATTSVDITGLNIGKGDEVVLVSDVWNPKSTGDYLMYFNNNNNKINYYEQYLAADSTYVVSGRYNDMTLGNNIGNTRKYFYCNIKLTNSGYIVVQSTDFRRIGSPNIAIAMNAGTTTFTATSITQIKITSSVANAIGIGSRFQLYKIGGA